MRWLMLVMLLVACGTEPSGFAGHTRAHFTTEADFDAFCHTALEGVRCKVEIAEFDHAQGHTFVLDPRFYSLHDEWYWYRLLNGQPMPGDDVQPWSGQTFATIAAVYKRFHPGDAHLPLDLAFYGDRLYSKRFYDNAGLCVDSQPDTQCPRKYGATEIQHLPVDARRNSPQELWLFALEYGDAPTAIQLGQFFHRLQAVLPAEIAPKLKWLARTSDRQEALARTLQSTDGPLRNRVLTYADLMLLGDARPLSEGLGAGYVVRFPQAPPTPLQVQPDDVVVTRVLPADLPPVAAVLVTEPIDPTSAVVRRMQALGVPVAQAPSALDDDTLQGYAKFHSQKALVAVGQAVRVQPLSAALAPQVPLSPLLQPPPPPPGKSLVWQGKGGPLTVPEIGWQGAVLALAAELKPEDAPLLLTARSGRDRSGPVLAVLATLAQEQGWQDPRLQRLLLDGRPAFIQAALDDIPARAWLAAFDAQTHSPAVTKLSAQGGAVRWLRELPTDPSATQALTDAVTQRFQDLPHDQALCLTGSPTDLDVPGLYPPVRAFLHPAEQPLPQDLTKTLESALAEVWSQQVSALAVASRRRAGWPQFGGDLAVVVQPCVPTEALQGVRTFASETEPLELQGSDIPPFSTPTGGLPALRGAQLVNRTLLTAQAWLAAENAGLPTARLVDTQTLELQWALVPDGWLGGDERWVWTGARVDPHTPAIAAPGSELAPPDRLAQATTLLRWTCLAANDTVTLTQLDTLSRWRLTPQSGFLQAALQRPGQTSPLPIQAHFEVSLEQGEPVSMLLQEEVAVAWNVAPELALQDCQGQVLARTPLGWLASWP
jgi:hypothetical protein